MDTIKLILDELVSPILVRKWQDARKLSHKSLLVSYSYKAVISLMMSILLSIIISIGSLVYYCHWNVLYLVYILSATFTLILGAVLYSSTENVWKILRKDLLELQSLMPVFAVFDGYSVGNYGINELDHYASMSLISVAHTILRINNNLSTERDPERMRSLRDMEVAETQKLGYRYDTLKKFGLVDKRGWKVYFDVIGPELLAKESAGGLSPEEQAALVLAVKTTIAVETRTETGI